MAQLYVSPAPTNTIARPVKELKGFTKIFLQPVEEKQIFIPLDKLATSFYDETAACWISEAGLYDVHIGISSVDICLTASLNVERTTKWLTL